MACDTLFFTLHQFHFLRRVASEKINQGDKEAFSCHGRERRFESRLAPRYLAFHCPILSKIWCLHVCELIILKFTM